MTGSEFEDEDEDEDAFELLWLVDEVADFDSSISFSLDTRKLTMMRIIAATWAKFAINSPSKTTVMGVIPTVTVTTYVRMITVEGKL